MYGGYKSIPSEQKSYRFSNLEKLVTLVQENQNHFIIDDFRSLFNLLSRIRFLADTKYYYDLTFQIHLVLSGQKI